MFSSIPTYDRYRTLRLASPQMVGEDVYALQTALTEIGFTVTQDGILGPLTSRAITSAQVQMGLTVDGLAGGNTQKALAMRVANSVQFELGLLGGVLKGSLEHESGFRLGNYSPLHADGVNYDAGVAQRNTALTPAVEGFDVPKSVAALGKRVRVYYDLFEGVPTNVRRWALAQGSWNAPAFACYLAREEGATKVKPSQCLDPNPAQRAVFEAYVAAVSKYL